MGDAALVAWLVDLVIAFTLVEAAALLLYRSVTGRGVASGDFALNMLSGLCLMLALRGFARDSGVAWIALCLLGAGLMHGADIWLRWRRDACTLSDRLVTT